MKNKKNKRRKYPYYVGYQINYCSRVAFYYCAKCGGMLNGLDELFESVCTDCRKYEDDDDYTGSFCG